MIAKSILWVTAAALLIGAAPVNAQSITPPPTLDTMCQDGSVDNAFQQAAAVAGQTKTQDEATIWEQQPKVDVRKMYCLNSLMGQYQSFVGNIQGLTDPMGVMAAIMTNIMTGILNQTCSETLASVSAMTGGSTAIAKICIPMPSFGFVVGGVGGNNGLNIPTCSGSAQIPLLQTGTGGIPLSSFATGKWLNP